MAQEKILKVLAIMSIKNKGRILLVLLIAQIAVILGSWLWSAAMPESAVRSLLSESGIRWFFGTFQTNLASPLLVWIVLLGIAAGTIADSDMLTAVKSVPSGKAFKDANQRSGLRAAIILILAEVGVMLLLILPRQATLLSVTGRLYPSSFSESLVPFIAAMGVTSAVVYGLFSGTLHSYKDVSACLLNGGKRLKTVLVFYVFAIELYYMVRYAFFS